MYNNIGGKLKGLAKVIGIGGAALSALAFFICLIIAGANDEWEEMTVLIITFLALIPVSIIASFPLYGFGELVEKVSKIADGKALTGNVPTQRKGYTPSGNTFSQKQSYAGTVTDDLPEL